ncbi:hypothetical protein ABK046_47920, partial [Streptomyces caeruleatus]
PVHDRIVVTDCRYPNEALWLRTEGAHLVGITRRQALAVREHSSEQHAEMLYGQADTLIVNDDSSLASLHQQLDGLMATLQLDTRAPL